MRNKHIPLFLLFLANLLCSHAHSYNNAQDTTASKPIPTQSVRKAFSREFTFAPLPLLAGGIILKSENSDFREYTHTFVRHSDHPLSHYGRFLPVGIVGALKLFGVPTRSSWERLVVNGALSGAITVGATELLKQNTRELRPDESDTRSFPSGHTSIAFACATIMHKELGETSSWYSVGAYSFATLIAFDRITSNRHWVHDIVTGAGIGILSTEAGYFIGDLLYNDVPDSKRADNPYEGRSNIYAGMGVGLNRQKLPLPPFTFSTQNRNDEKPVGLTLQAASSAALQGGCSYKLTPHIAIAGEAGYFTSPVIVTEARPTYIGAIAQHCNEGTLFAGFKSGRWEMITANVALHIFHPLGTYNSLGFSLRAGDRYTLPWNLSAQYRTTDGRDEGGRALLHLTDNHALNIGGSIAINCRAAGSNLRFSVDYDYSEPRYSYRFNNITSNGILAPQQLSRRGHLSFWQIGVAILK